MAPLFRWIPLWLLNHPISGKGQKPARCSKRNGNWHTYTNPRPGQFLTHAQSHITLALAKAGTQQSRSRSSSAETRKHWGCECGRHLSLDPGASLLGIIKIWNISQSTATNQSAWYSRLANELRTLAPGISSIQC